MKNEQSLSKTRISRLRAQGYATQTEQELSELAFGIRFPYRLCVAILSIGVVMANIPILSVMLVLAFLGIVLPKHPFDYLYNHLLSARMNKPPVPPRAAQLKFACTIATAWIAGTISLFAVGMMTGGYIMGVLLILTASLPSTIDFCVPSLIYNALFGKKKSNKGVATS